jgi:hypothetical protein
MAMYRDIDEEKAYIAFVFACGERFNIRRRPFLIPALMYTSVSTAAKQTHHHHYYYHHQSG